MTADTSLLLQPLVSAKGDVRLPGSKSISNRVLLLAALAQGTTRVQGLLDSDDTRVMLDSLQKLGVSLTEVDIDSLDIDGSCPFPAQEAELFLGNAGTAFRPLTGALAFMQGNFRLSGVPRMHERPIGDLVDALRQAGAHIDYQGNEGYPPLAISPPTLGTDGPVRIKGSVSSQFLTSLLMAGPIYTAATGRDLVIEVDGVLISRPYILITLNLMARFGVDVKCEGWQRFTIPASAVYRAPGVVAVEGDASSASYFMALGAIGGGPMHIHGVGSRSIQGDVAFADTLQTMGADITWHENSIEVSGVNVAKGERLKAFDEDFNLIPDAAMTAAALALYADGPCTLRNIGSWRVKETDRIHAMATELRKLGAKVEEGSDWLRVHPLAREDWREASIATYDDHRMAMCFSLAAFGPKPIVIEDPECVSKTFPDYFSVFQGVVSA
ncbi:3-phosphoshikimate 1-carboxyvinyltransferase [Pusillimonas sp. (ex Stolz et al. 2005)]|uniref:3-phosphoshikimate 1-carboxyvinyltransferase n=1 Tax=Pusillimonas sp. (ex Stolz et al. 2005) TaxID=1979962 RepID=UPI002636763E|nr:3-phosphoshikimate 1-carboxyvinyltransferase [Pusillimonas sp. (ex Stolz et al. 2005)]